MSDDLVSDLLSLKPLLEAHHCRTDAIDRAIAAIRKDDELRDALAFVRESIRNCGATAHIGGTVSWLVPDEVMLKLRSALSSVAGGGG